jgi:hypothetical protein
VLALTTAFYAVWWAPKSRNSAWHSVIGCAYFAAASLTYLALNVGISYWRVAVASQSATLSCLILWAIVLSATGETVRKREPLKPATTAAIIERFTAMVKAVRTF